MIHAELTAFSLVNLLDITNVTATGQATGVDITDYKNISKVILTAANNSGTTPTLDVKLQESSTVGGTYTDITGAAYTQVTTTDGSQEVHVNLSALSGFIRVHYTLGGTSPDYDLAVVAVARSEAK